MLPVAACHESIPAFLDCQMSADQQLQLIRLASTLFTLPVLMNHCVDCLQWPTLCKTLSLHSIRATAAGCYGGLLFIVPRHITYMASICSAQCMNLQYTLSRFAKQCLCFSSFLSLVFSVRSWWGLIFLMHAGSEQWLCPVAAPCSCPTDHGGLNPFTCYDPSEYYCRDDAPDWPVSGLLPGWVDGLGISNAGTCEVAGLWPCMQTHSVTCVADYPCVCK